MDKKVPCKDCDKRHLGCHAECEDYKQWRSAKDKANQGKFFESQLNNAKNGVQYYSQKYWRHK